MWWPNEGGFQRYLVEWDCFIDHRLHFLPFPSSFDRPTGNDFGYSVAADSTGVYLTGAAGAQSTGSGMDSDDDTDAFVVKYNSTGGMVWEQRWGSSDADVGNGVAVDDGSGLVYVVGKTWGAMGREVWTPNTDTQTNGDDGEAGSTGGINAGLTDVFLTCLDATNGEIQWTVQFGSSAADVGNSVAVGPRGGVFFVGQLGDDDPSARPRAFLAKYDYLGNSQVRAALLTLRPMTLPFFRVEFLMEHVYYISHI